MRNIKNSIFIFLMIVISFFILNSLMDARIINGYYSGIIMIICINIILATSLNLITGFTGQLCLGHAGFMAIGAYSSAIITAKLNMPFFVGILTAGIMTVLIALLVGIPTLKLKGDYFAITTLGVGEIIRGILVNIDYVGGARGFSAIPPKTTFLWCFTLMVITVVIIRNLIKSSYGRNMIAIRENEIAAEAMGVNTFKFKIIAFIIAAFFAGIAGALYANYNTYIDPGNFNYIRSIEIVTFVVLGGMGSLSGSIIATIVLTFLPEVFREFKDLRMVVYSLTLVIMMLFRPQGLMGKKEISFNFIKKIVGNKLKVKEGNANA